MAQMRGPLFNFHNNSQEDGGTGHNCSLFAVICTENIVIADNPCHLWATGMHDRGLYKLFFSAYGNS